MFYFILFCTLLFCLFLGQVVLLCSCILAFFLNYSIFLNTTLNSALTQTICGNLKVCLPAAICVFMSCATGFEQLKPKWTFSLNFHFYDFVGSFHHWSWLDGFWWASIWSCEYKLSLLFILVLIQWLSPCLLLHCCDRILCYVFPFCSLTLLGNSLVFLGLGCMHTISSLESNSQSSVDVFH